MKTQPDPTDTKSMKVIRQWEEQNTRGYVCETACYRDGDIIHTVNGAYHSTTGPAQKGPNFERFWIHGYQVSPAQVAAWKQICVARGLDQDDPSSLDAFEATDIFETVPQIIERYARLLLQ